MGKGEQRSSNTQSCEGKKTKSSRTVEKKTSAKPKKNPKVMKCGGRDHALKFKYPRDAVPVIFFRREPENPKSTLFKRCKECRTTATDQRKRLAAKRKKIAIEKGTFYCASCNKEQSPENRSINKDGSKSNKCFKCKDKNKNRPKKVRDAYNKIKKEMIFRYQCSCQKCKCIYLKNGDIAICLKTFEGEIGRCVKYKGEISNVTDFLNEKHEDLELTIIQLDHITEKDQRQRGLLKIGEPFIPKKNNVSELGSESAMRLESLKTQNLCAKCHLEETMNREEIRGNGVQRRSIATREKKKFVNNYKKELGGCCICGYENNEFLRFFHMDHIEPEDKIEGIGSMIMMAKYTIDDVEAELKKCRMLCTHCHLIHTQKQHEKGVIQIKKQKKTANTIAK